MRKRTSSADRLVEVVGDAATEVLPQAGAAPWAASRARSTPPYLGCRALRAAAGGVWLIGTPARGSARHPD